MNTLHRIVSLAIIVTSTIALVSAASGGIGERMGQGMDRPEGQGRMLMGSGMMGSGKSSRGDMGRPTMGGSGIDMPKRMENKGSGMTRPPKDGNGNATGAVLTPEQLSCVASAVTVRESALASSFSKFSTTIMSMMSTRSSALDTAWKISDRATRRTAIDTAWKSTNDTARETRKTDDMSAIDAFKSATSTCKVGNESLDLGGLMMRE